MGGGRWAAQSGADCTGLTLRWTQVRGWLRKLCAAVQLSILGTATVAMFLVSLVGSASQDTRRGAWEGAGGAVLTLPPCL